MNTQLDRPIPSDTQRLVSTAAQLDNVHRAAAIVAHPDDEILWCGGLILEHLQWSWRIVSLCRASDADRASRFRRVLQQLGVGGEMADLDDGPDQRPLPLEQVQAAVMQLLPATGFDLVLTHGPLGEYTRHRRHEECSRAVVELWRQGRIRTKRMWLFAYEDGNRTYMPRIRDDADRCGELPQKAWLAKRAIITDLYGFGPESWEARTTPREEGFWCFDSSNAASERIAALEYKR